MFVLEADKPRIHHPAGSRLSLPLSVCMFTCVFVWGSLKMNGPSQSRPSGLSRSSTVSAGIKIDVHVKPGRL